MAYNKESFIKKSKQIHGDKYDYSKIEYKGCNVKVCIICPEHGEFWQQPSKHLLGSGCQKCGKIRTINSLKQTTEEFIKKAKKVHGNKYDYSKVEYKGYNEKICIICPEHGEFWQTPINHISKHQSHGCPECGKTKSKTIEQFIQDAINIHGNKYDYSKVNYVNSKTKVCIICPEHTEFNITPYKHLKGQGCPICNRKILNKENFIEKAKQVHGNKYDYSHVNYINSYTKVKIICPIHGEFQQTPIKHLKNVGCIKCYNEQQIQYTYEECFQKAKQYKYLLDFKIENKKMYNYAIKKNWIKDYTWINKMTYNDFKDKKRIIYAYEFLDNHVYIGLTNWPERRDNQHRSFNIKNRSSVKDYAINTNQNIPEMKILEENLTIVESQKAENKWMDIYKNNGWNLINKVKGGSIGGITSFKITKEMAIEESKKYKNLEDIRQNNRPYYNFIIKNNLKFICFPNTIVFNKINKENNVYTEDFIKEMTNKYKTTKDLRKNEVRVYKWLQKHKRLYEFYQKPSEKFFNRNKKII